MYLSQKSGESLNRTTRILQKCNSRWSTQERMPRNKAVGMSPGNPEFLNGLKHALCLASLGTLELTTLSYCCEGKTSTWVYSIWMIVHGSCRWVWGVGSRQVVPLVGEACEWEFECWQCSTASWTVGNTISAVTIPLKNCRVSSSDRRVPSRPKQKCKISQTRWALCFHIPVFTWSYSHESLLYHVY